MSENESESLSEREFAAELEGKIPAIFGLEQKEQEQQQEQQQEFVADEAPGRPPEPEPSEGAPEAVPAEEPGTEEGEPEEPEDEGSLSWARRKYGEDVTLEKIAKVAFDQEQQISRLGTKGRENENLAVEWYQYSQNLETQLQRQPTGMPMSSQEEQWVEQALTNPVAYALQAKMSGNEQLYRAVINRVSQEDPLVAGQVATYAEMTAAEQARAQAQSPEANGETAEVRIGASVQRLGIDLPRFGQAMMTRIGELGEYHPYTQAILYGTDENRDLAFQAVYDLVREGSVTRQTVRNTEREEALKKEGELRRQAAGVLTGTPRSSTPPPQSPFLDAMEAEWKRAGQWSDE